MVFLIPGCGWMENDVASQGSAVTVWDPARRSPLPAGILEGRIKGRGLGLTAGLVILLLAASSLLVPLLPLNDPLAPDYNHILQAPGRGHLLGTDLHGRDQLSRVAWAARSSLAVAAAATGLALIAGMATGGAAAYGGRLFDAACMRAADVFLSFPAVLGAMAMMAIFGPGRRNVLLAIAFFGWPVFARLFRSSVLSTRERGYVRAARILGAGKTRIFFRHVLPNSITPLISYSAMSASAAILVEAGLSFINLGVQRPNPSWGLMLAESMGMFEQSPWLAIVPGAAVTVTALAFILLGIVLNQTLEPREAIRGSSHLT